MNNKYMTLEYQKGLIAKCQTKQEVNAYESRMTIVRDLKPIRKQLLQLCEAKRISFTTIDIDESLMCVESEIDTYE